MMYVPIDAQIAFAVEWLDKSDKNEFIFVYLSSIVETLQNAQKKEALKDAEFVMPTIETIGGEVKTLRDEFAMAALTGIVAKIPFAEYEVGDYVESYDAASRGAYEYADAMLEARNKEQNKC